MRSRRWSALAVAVVLPLAGCGDTDAEDAVGAAVADVGWPVRVEHDSAAGVVTVWVDVEDRPIGWVELDRIERRADQAAAAHGLEAVVKLEGVELSTAE